MAKRKRYLFVCVNRRADGEPKGSCAARGSVELYERLKRAVSERGLAATSVRVCTSSCLDLCWAGPAIAVTPDDVFLGRADARGVDAIVDALENEHELTGLALTPDDFETPQELRKREPRRA